MIDEAGQTIQAKKCDLIHSIRTTFSPDVQTVSLRHRQESPSPFLHLTDDKKALESWLGAHLKQRVFLKENVQTGFPDDLQSPGPTVVAAATLKKLTEWFPGLELAEIRRRFRCNIEIGQAPPFWEDQLCAQKGTPQPFQLGAVHFLGINPCQRCNVPQKDSQSGEKYPDFVKIFKDKRQSELPVWAQSSQFDHFYRLCINTCLADQLPGLTLQVGDEVRIGKSI